MTKILIVLHQMIWGIPALVLILGVGLYLTVRAGFPQVFFFRKAIRNISVPQGDTVSGLSSAQALCTALAATVGTGNLVGVAGAICLGGPGAIFWMWICGFLGMATKFAEAVLAVRYQERQGKVPVGGPMYMIRNGLPVAFLPLATMYAVFGLIACLGVGNSVQVQSVVSGVNTLLSKVGVPVSFGGSLLIGAMIGCLIAAALMGGIQRVGKVSEKLVPIASGAYIVLCVILLILRRNHISDAFRRIFTGAFSPKAVTGGMLGSLYASLRVGCSRGVFTNEAGLGTASMAYASVSGGSPVEKGMLGLLEVFLDTIVICTLTALAVLCSGVDIPYGNDIGAILTMEAFSSVFGDWVSVFLTACMCLFAFATILGWGIYGLRCAQYLVGTGCRGCFIIIQFCMILISSVMTTETVWLFAETVNGLMAIPNLLAIILLSPELLRLIKEYKEGGCSA